MLDLLYKREVFAVVLASHIEVNCSAQSKSIARQAPCMFVCIALVQTDLISPLVFVHVHAATPTAKCAFAHGEHELKVQTLNEM
jgi:hypothetical protein